MKFETSLANTRTVPKSELKGTQFMEVQRTDFEIKYWALTDDLTGALWLDPAFIRSLIAHESRFEEKAQNDKGSKWFMQLTSHPINDLLARPEFFAPIFKKIYIGIIPVEAPEALHALRSAFEVDPIDKAEIARVVPLLQNLKKDPVTNLVIGHVFFAALEARTGKNIDRRELALEKTIGAIIWAPSLTKQVFKRVAHLLPGVTAEEVVQSLQTIKWDAHKRSEFLAIKDYNGNKHPYLQWIVHSDIYASVIMSVQILAGIEQKYAKRILGIKDQGIALKKSLQIA